VNLYPNLTEMEANKAKIIQNMYVLETLQCHLNHVYETTHKWTKYCLHHPVMIRQKYKRIWKRRKENMPSMNLILEDTLGFY
jgi:uncharacterized damage-inducible protein DinB